MYNRYIPQPDGSYQRKRIQEKRPPGPTPPKLQHEPIKENCAPPTVKQEFCPPPRPQPPCRSPIPHKSDSILSFFRQLLPKELETADLLIIILLLLMAGDCEEDRNNALLTLALYFFM